MQSAAPVRRQIVQRIREESGSGRGSLAKEFPSMRNAVALTLMLLLGLLPAAAADLRLAADIPFPFVVKGKTLPAGEYEIIPVLQSVFAIRDVQTFASAMMLVNREPDRTYRAPVLVFNTRDNTNTLTTITADGESFLLLRPKTERTRFAGSGNNETRVILARRK